MAPIHHHFEADGLVGDQDHAPLLDHRGGLLGIGFTLYQQAIGR